MTEFFDSEEYTGDEDDAPLKPAAPKLATVDELFGRAHYSNILISHFSGTLGSYLYALGYTTGDEVTEIEQRIEQLMPTYKEASIEKLTLLETELSQSLFGGANRIIVGFTEDGDTTQELEVFDSITRRAEALMDLIKLKLKLRDEINESL